MKKKPQKIVFDHIDLMDQDDPQPRDGEYWVWRTYQGNADHVFMIRVGELYNSSGNPVDYKLSDLKKYASPHKPYGESERSGCGLEMIKARDLPVGCVFSWESNIFQWRGENHNFYSGVNVGLSVPSHIGLIPSDIIGMPRLEEEMTHADAFARVVQHAFGKPSETQSTEVEESTNGN